MVFAHLQRYIRVAGCVLCLLLLVVTDAQQASAASLTVNATSPYVVADGVCSLIEAIANANDDAQTHADCPAGNGADTITLSENVTLDGTDVFSAFGASGLPALTSDMTIQGNNRTIERDSSAPAFRLLTVGDGATVTVENLTVRNGLLTGGFDNGGGIYNAGNLTVINTTLEDNRVEAIFPSGGGIYNRSNGTLTVIDSLIQNNVVDDPDSVFDDGGGIYAQGPLVMLNSVITGNRAAESAGGVYAASDTTIVNTVISNNIAAENGGGMVAVGGAATGVHRIYNTTFSNNT
ncbi:MAG: right-handed parallel beta-helix repeat-containing protein, partial [Chloroflexota bacterium]